MARKRLVDLYKEDKRNYEICLILTQKLSDEGVKKINENFKKLIEKEGGQVVECSVTKLMSFCYAINTSNNHKGYYVCFYSKMDSASINIVKAKLLVESEVLRVLIKLANPKKQSYGIFSSQYNTDAYKNKNKFFSYDDPVLLSRFLSERARIAGRKVTLGKNIAKNVSKKQRSVSKVIKTARAFALLPYQED